ncbi:MAG: fixJ [Tardiphaga sp.]|jgi:two-component system response regulator FixJ|nr:fixJ [Tardiphaga sp.]
MHEASVHVIDDDDAVRDSLAFLLRSIKLPVQVYDSGIAFAKVLPSLRKGCIVSDIRMPGYSGLDLLREVGTMPVRLPVIIITGHADVPLAVEAMKLGASEFFEKPFHDDRMIAAVQKALDGAKAESEVDLQKVDVLSRFANLSKREDDVLHGLVAGKSNKMIAFDLQISPRTVEIYRANVMTKMDAGSLSELVRMAIVSGIT